MTASPIDQLHYHVAVEGSEETYTVTTPAAARKLRRELPQIGETAHVYECHPSDTACPLHSDRPQAEEETSDRLN